MEDLEFLMPLPPPGECWSCRCVPLQPARFSLYSYGNTKWSNIPMLTLPESSDASLHSCLDLSCVFFEVLCGISRSFTF